MTSAPAKPANNLTIQLLQDELEKRGYTQQAYAFRDEFVTFTAPNGWKWLTRKWAVTYPFIPHAVQVMCKNKYLAYEFADQMGVTIPHTMSYPADDDAIEAFVSKYAPIIAKPLDSSGSRGITLNITDKDGAIAAAKQAQRYSPTVLLQQQVRGSEVRFTVVEGKVISVMHRSTPKVIGDGKRTVAELIQADNTQRRALSMPYLKYPQLDESLIDERFLRDRSVPEAGEEIELNKSALISRGASLYDISDDIHQSYIQTAEKLAAELNPTFLVVDMLIEDFAQPITKTNYCFLEFNTAPVLRMYYSVRDGRQYDIVSKLADMIDAESRK